MHRGWLVVVLLAALAGLPMRGQTQIYQPPQDYTAVVLAPDFPSWPPQACPNNTGNVLTGFYNLAFETQYISLGCCAIGQYGVPLSDGSGLAGCCPIGQFPCLDASDALIGCTSDASLCCTGSLICPPGYGCCPTGVSPNNVTYISSNPCCPLLNTTNVATNYTAYCMEFDDPSYTDANFGNPVYGGCSQTTLALAASCQSVSTYVLTNATNITISTDAGLYCNTLAECVNVVTVNGPNNYTIGNFTYFNATYIQSTPGGCCPVGFEPCVNVWGVVVGCANTTNGESCCGTTICPRLSSCCFQGSGSNTTYYGCCASGLDCCYASLGLFDPGLQNITQMFCGSYTADGCKQDMYLLQSLFGPGPYD